ncbi:hypothetical protein DL93DRAFT_106878 [Clavulina sp. PMI_390]|nr:hypothetical protein DL93DRAFT_106878 [Clavulina sp. PMI_390]
MVHPLLPPSPTPLHPPPQPPIPIIDMLPDSDPRELLASVTGSAVKFQFPKESWHVRSARKDKAAAAAAAAQQQQQQGQQQYPAPNQTIGPTSAVHDPSRDREAERNATHAVHTSLNAAMDRENSIDFGTPGAAGGGGGGTTFGVAPFSYANAGGSWKAGSGAGAGGGGAPPRGKQAEYNYDYDANGNAMGPPATSPSPFGNASSFAQQQQQQQQGMGAGLRRPSTGLGFANVNTTNANANGRNTGMPPPPSPTTANNSTTTLSSAAAHPPIHQGLIGSGVSGLSNPNAGRQRSLTGPPPAISARAGFHGALHHHHPHHLHHQHQPHQPSGLSRGSTFPPTPSSAPANGGFATPAPPSSANNGNGNASGVPSLNLSFVHPPPSRKVIAPGSVSSSSSSSSTASSSGRKSPSTTSLLASPFKSGGANVNGHSHSHSSGSFAPCACLHTSSPSSAPGSPSEQGTGAEGSSELVTVGAATGGGESGAEAFVANLLANIRDVTAFLEGLHPLSMGNLSLEEKDEGGADGEEGGAGAGVASSGSSRGVEENGRRYPVGVKGVGDCSVVRCLNQLDRAIR